MGPKKSRQTSRKRAAHNGGGKRPPPKPPQPAVASSVAASSSDSDESELHANPAAKAAKAIAGASPRASSRATTPRASEAPSPRASSPPPASVDVEKELRKWQKKLREIELLMERDPAALNSQQQEKLLRWGEVGLKVERLQALLAAAVVEPQGTAEDVEGEQEGDDAAMAQYRTHDGSRSRGSNQPRDRS